MWNPVTKVFHALYQTQDRSTGALLQFTEVATSPDGITWTYRAKALPNPPTSVLGHDHTGYAKLYYLHGLWAAWSNMADGFSLWWSYDGLYFVRDPRRLRGMLHWSEGTLRTALGGLFRYRGEWWTSGVAGTFTSGITYSSVQQCWMAPVNPNLRTLRGRPQFFDLPPVGAETEATGIPHAWCEIPGGRLAGVYRMNGPNGALGLAVMS